jgi:hypothetical protein
MVLACGAFILVDVLISKESRTMLPRSHGPETAAVPFWRVVLSIWALVVAGSLAASFQVTCACPPRVCGTFTYMYSCFSSRCDCVLRLMPTSTTLACSTQILPHNDITLPRELKRTRTYLSLPQDVLITSHQWWERKCYGAPRRLPRLSEVIQQLH